MHWPKVLGASISFFDLLGTVCATVGLKNVIVKMLHTKTQSSDANVPDSAKLLISQCSWLTLKGYFFGFIPRQQGLHAIC